MAREKYGIRLTLNLHKFHSLIASTANIAGAMTRIFKIAPGDNQLLYWTNDLPFQLKLFTAGGVELEPEAVLALYKVSPGEQEETLLGTQTYAAWRNTAFADQSDPEREDNLSIPFNKSAVISATIPPGYWLEMRLRSTAVVSWGHTGTQFFVNIGQEVVQ